MPKPYTVKPGDTLWGIAKLFGYPSWQGIYEHADNKAFRTKRPNPKLILPGDVLLLPDLPFPADVVTGTGITLRRGDRGEEVRRLQHNLNEALGCRFTRLTEDGIFEKRTEDAVRLFQRIWRLRRADGIVGIETRYALATRVFFVEGRISRTPCGVFPSSASSGPAVAANAAAAVRHAPSPAPTVAPAVSPTAKKEENKPAWQVQGQPSVFQTPAPWAYYDPKHGKAPSYSISSAALQLGFVYQTKTEGPNWQFSGAMQGGYNTRVQASDPRYTIQAQGQVAYADPFSIGPLHSAIFAQVATSINLQPNYATLGLGVGAQLGVDIVKDHLQLYAQGMLGASWVLDGPGKGQFMLAPQVTLGVTVQFKVSK